MSGINVDYQTILHGYSLRNSLLLKYAATLRCKVKLTFCIIVFCIGIYDFCENCKCIVLLSIELDCWIEEQKCTLRQLFHA